MAEKRKRWIQKATDNAHGQFAAKAERAGKTTREFAAEHDKDPGRTGKQARLAETLMGMGRKRSTHKQRMHALYGKKD